jgi:hypothetical protein
VSRAGLLALVVLLAAPPAAGAAPVRSLPVDCLPDGVQNWDSPQGDAGYGALHRPGIVLGPPGASTPTTQSTSVASLGFAGSMTWRLEDVVLEDRPGPDFIVFENAFFHGAVPAGPDDPYRVFHEPAFVEVSADGLAWHRFPHDRDALAEAAALETIDLDLRRRLVGLAGITPTFSGNWTVPDDLHAWDEAGTGGISGAGGDAFDLATVGLAEARFVRLVDTDVRNGPAGAAEGFDVDALVLLHARPVAPAAADADGDGLADAVEPALYGTFADAADSDGDGTDDGREVAACRDPLGPGTEPVFQREPRLWLRGGACTEVRWTWLGDGLEHDVVRGDVAALFASGGMVDLGPLDCLAERAWGVRWSCDETAPAPAAALFYLVRIHGDGAGWGRSSALEPRGGSGGCP